MSRVMHRAIAVRPDLAIGGEGLTLTLEDGRRIIDGSGGAAVACLGHGNARVAAAVGAQARRLAYVHTGFFTSQPAEELAELLLGSEPAGLSRAFFVSSGSEAMESALKLARQYFIERGEPRRTCFIGRRQSYHGNTLGSLAAGGNVSRRIPYEPIFSNQFSLVSPCFPFHYKRADESDSQYVARLASELEEEFQRLGPESVAAFCAEPVVGATAGCVTAVPGYFPAVREVCDRYGALLILDEIMCGSGRTGTMHAWEQEGIAPDIQAIGKSLGGGYAPIAGILISKRVVETLRSGSGAFVHGHTYQAHPVACAAALEVQRIIQEEQLLENVNLQARLLQRLLEEHFGDHEHVGDIRGRGLFFAIEFLKDRSGKIPFDPSLRVHERIKDAALEAGLGIYPSGGTIDGRIGDHALIAPPYNSHAHDIEVIVGLLAEAVRAALPAYDR